MIGYSDCFRQNVLVCLIQDLKNAYVYWDFKPERIQTIRTFINNVKSGMKVYLRLCSQQSLNNKSIAKEEIELSQIEPGNYYFRNLDSDLIYHFEFGGYDHNGNYILFNRTPSIQLKPIEDSVGEYAVNQIVSFSLNSNESESDFLKIASSWS